MTAPTDPRLEPSPQVGLRRPVAFGSRPAHVARIRAALRPTATPPITRATEGR
jgi:hypothetical protein